ncbi:MAG: class I SAM-dependent methyltransferase [Cyclobacteriaceae bacterium]|nr:class I SAM-dependent methyltransferase [Cyclobacteriaceae bacterium]
MIAIDQCPVCSRTDFQNHLSCEDTTVSHETFLVKVCTGCGLGITSPRPPDEKLSEYYQSNDYISHSGNSSGLIGRVYMIARKFTLRWKRRLVEKYNTRGALLDYGCGTGEFLAAMQQKGWHISGVEPSSAARQKATSLTGKEIENSLENLKQEAFNIITLWHVLEHVHELNSLLKKLNVLLPKDGTIFIAVPNYESADSLHYNQHWAGYDVPRHLWHFSKKSMFQLLDQNGFRIKSIKPMKLDAFYISLLSEKNQGNTGIRGIVNGFLWGVWSNYKAGKTLNHSSLIYIAQPR